METFGLIIFYLVILAAFVTLPFGIPGTIIIWLDALIYGWLTHFHKISPHLVLGLLALTVVAEVADNVLTAAGARKYGTSKKGIVASMIGAVLGAIVGGHLLALTGIIGIAVGPVVGAFAGAFAAVFMVERAQGKDKQSAIRAGYGAMVGRVGGMVLKVVLAVVMIVLLVRAVNG